MMKALVFDGMLKVSEHAAKPASMPGEALIRVREAAGAQILAVACPQRASISIPAQSRAIQDFF